LQGAASEEPGDKSQDSTLHALSSSLIALDKKSLDVSDPNAVSEAISYYKSDVVINCAAYNSVDKAEEEAYSSPLSVAMD
jgi:dTDP-4-dehydrorhamnose reductase